MEAKAEKTIRGSLCGPKYLRGITEPCDGSCCGMINGKPDPVLTETINRRTALNRRNDDAWRRILGA